MIFYKTRSEIEAIRRANQIVARVLKELRPQVKPGVTTRELDAYAERRALELGAKPAFKGYNGYPASLCTSVNQEVIHGIPSGRVLREGDLVGLDFGVILDGFYGDAAVTVAAGEISPLAERIKTVVEESFFKGLEQVRPGNRISDISAAVQKHAEANGFSVIRSFVGHGIGFQLHEDPQIPNFGEPGHGPRIREGMTMAIEPMIAAGDWNVDVLDDNWTAVTRDGSLSAHFEHTIAVMAEGPEILSLWEEESEVLAAKESKHA
jgi:methionyl aminopeptidase